MISLALVIVERGRSAAAAARRVPAVTVCCRRWGRTLMLLLRLRLLLLVTTTIADVRAWLRLPDVSPWGQAVPLLLSSTTYPRRTRRRVAPSPAAAFNPTAAAPAIVPGLISAPGLPKVPRRGLTWANRVLDSRNHGAPLCS